MPKKSADKSIPPPLRSLGGWLNADWFDTSILGHSEVIGIVLPALPGSRKQNFELAERSKQQPTPRKQGVEATATPGPSPSGIGEILDGVGMIQAASFRRSRFFFEAAPTLFFADIPAARLKARAGEALRQDLIRNGLRGCVLSCRAAEVTAMFWLGNEVEVTGFVRAAQPPYALHPQFSQADAERSQSELANGRRLGGSHAAKDRTNEQSKTPLPTKANRAERERLLGELDGLRSRIIELEGRQSIRGAMDTLGLDDSRLKAMLLLLHPDKHGGGEAANDAAKWINGLRDVLKTNRASYTSGFND